MNSKTFTLVVITLMSIGLLIHNAEGGERKTKEELATMSCKQLFSYLVKEGMAALMACGKKLKYKSQKEREEKKLCVMKCIAIEEGIIEPDGTITRERADKFIVENVPDRFHKMIYPVLDECVFGKDLPPIDPKDELCRSYEPIMKCVMNKFGKEDPNKLCDKYAKEFAEGK